jgi:HPt (histidine-containing phosphotransfer) domain-containing protein
VTDLLFDPEPLDGYLSEDGGLALVSEIAEIFAEDLPRRFRGLRDALAAGDDERVRHWAHAIKGGGAIAGAKRLAALAEAIEQAPASQACAAAQTRVDEMEAVFDASKRAMNDWVDAQKSRRG